MDPANYCNEEQQKRRSAKRTPQALGAYVAKNNFLVIKIFGLMLNPETYSQRKLTDRIRNSVGCFSDQQFEDSRIVVHDVLTSEDSDDFSVHVDISVRHNDLNLVQTESTEGLIEGVCRAVWDLMTMEGKDERHQLSVCLNRYDASSSILARDDR